MNFLASAIAYSKVLKKYQSHCSHFFAEMMILSKKDLMVVILKIFK